MWNKTGKQAAQAACFLLVLALLLEALGWLYRPRDNTEAGGIPLEKAMGYLSEPADSIDVFFLGSSEFYSGIAPLRIWDESGITSYDVAIASLRLYQADYYLSRVLETHHPKLVVVDAYMAFYPANLDAALFYTLAKPFPILLNHNNWAQFGLKELAAPVNYTNHQQHKGFRPRGLVQQANFRRFMRGTLRREPAIRMNRLYLEHIQTMCRRAGAELMLLSVPSTVNWNYARHNTTQDYADSLGVPFLDLNLLTRELGLDPTADFRDGGDHLNGFGAKKVSIYLAAYLKEQYALTDHRGDAAYRQWQLDDEAVLGE